MIVVDASAVIDLLLRTPKGLEVAKRVLGDDVTLHVPHLLEIEVAHALRRYTLHGELSVARGSEALADLSDLPLNRYPHSELLSRVWALRTCLSAYDAAYAALAEALDARIVTTDGRFSRAHGHAAEIELIHA